MIPVSSSSSSLSSTPSVKESNSNYVQKRTLRLQKYEDIVLRGDEFPDLRTNKDSFSAKSQDQFWRRRLKEKYSGKNCLVFPGGNNELFFKIEQLYQQKIHQPIIPETNSANSNLDELSKISFETIFLHLLKEQLNKIKYTFEQLSVALGETTEKGIDFRSVIISALNPADYASFKKYLEDVQKQNPKISCLIKKCMGFDKKAEFPNILSQYYVKLQTIFDSCVKDITSYHHRWKNICSVVQEAELKIAEIDKIPLSDVKRSVLGDSGRNLEIKINQVTPESSPSYYQALISLIDKFVQLPHNESERIEFANSLMRNEEVGAKYFSRILRLCSINAWSHASKLIEKEKKGFRKVPYITKFKDGMQCGVCVFSRNDYEVSQTKTLLVYKRSKPKEEGCLIAEGEPVATVTFKAVFHVRNDSCHLSLNIEKWSINTQAEFQDKLQVYRILSSHAAAARSL